MDQSQWIGVRSHEFRDISERIKVATRLSSKLSKYCWDEADLVREVFEELIGKPVGESFHLIPPFYADYGLNITVVGPSSSATSGCSPVTGPSTSPTKS
jgi:hypothetical protein